jgi:hypothetical protein
MPVIVISGIPTSVASSEAFGALIFGENKSPCVNITLCTFILERMRVMASPYYMLPQIPLVAVPTNCFSTSKVYPKFTKGEYINAISPGESRRN